MSNLKTKTPGRIGKKYLIQKLQTRLGTLALVAAILTAMPGEAHAEEATNIRPQMGVWFGPVTPAPFTAGTDVLDTFLGGGLFFRINWPFNIIRSEIDISWSYYSSNTTQGAFTMPIYYAGVYRLPVSLPVKLQVKGGLGTSYVNVEPENRNRWDPLWMVGFEGSFPAGRRVNIGLRVDWLYIMESHLDPPAGAPASYEISDFQFVNVGLMVNFFFTR